MSNKDLFSNFDAVSHQKWKEKIITDLKGKDYDETLIWHDSNSIQHHAFYSKESITEPELVSAIQHAQKDSKNWKIIDFKAIDNYHTQNYTHNLKNKESNTLDTLHKELLLSQKENKKILIDGNFFRQAGGTLVQELTFVLQQCVDYLDAGTTNGLNAQELVELIDFKLGFGTSYCSEIAKGRAFRYLIQQVYASYKINHEPTIIGEACNYYHAHKDSHTNLLRLTTQAMSAILGNCNQILLPAYDQIDTSSSLGERMSTNIGLILKEESFFEEVEDAAKGSYYIENLSAEITKQAWELFLSIEKEGGLINYTESGQLEKDLNESHLKKVTAYKNGEEKLLGVNTFINEKSTDLNPKVKDNQGIKTYILSTEIS